MISSYTHLIDYSESPGQAHATIPPRLFKSKEDAERYNSQTFPQGEIIKITIKVEK